MDNKLVDIKDIGKVRFIRSSRARRISISIRARDGVRVTVPERESITRATSFVLHKKDWINKNLEKLRREQGNRTVFNEETVFKTKHHQLKIIPHNKETIHIQVKSGRIHVYYPAHVEVAHERVQEAVRRGIEEALRIEAKFYLPRRTAELAKKYGFSYTKLTVRNSKSRWGSCSGKNRINLSLHMMQLPDHLIDYVILHELTHTVHKNHGPGFWQMLDEVTGNARGLDKQMRQFHTGIY